MNLLQLALAAEKLTQERPPVNLDAMRCHHVKDKDSPCNLCVVACPTEAIGLDGGVHVEADRCIRCGLCLHTCPTGVFSGYDGTHALLRCVDRLVDREIIEVACQHHPDPARGKRDVDAVIQTNGCLSAMSTAAYISLLALGVNEVRVRLDACADCPLRIVQPSLEKTVAQADALNADRDGGIRIAEAGRAKRPVYSVKNPPVSRRGFFRMAAMQTESAVDELAPRQEMVYDSGPPLERQRLIRALSRLDGLQPDAPVPDNSFIQMQASDDCTACGICARVCPTDALQIHTDADHFDLVFKPANCVNCGLCFTYCDPDALSAGGQPTYAEVISGQERTLIQGPLRYCHKCGAAFKSGNDDKLCPVCAARHENPFGVNLTPAVLKRLPEAARKRIQSSSTSTT